ncbi:hypothetical protein UlMin_030671 [Ulmus minor]
MMNTTRSKLVSKDSLCDLNKLLCYDYRLKVLLVKYQRVLQIGKYRPHLQQRTTCFLKIVCAICLIRSCCDVFRPLFSPISDLSDPIFPCSICHDGYARRILILRVGALAWSSSIMSSGSRDKSILQQYIHAHEDFVSKLSGHKSEVCKLKWSYDNRELASGGNDNRVHHCTIFLNFLVPFCMESTFTQPVLKYCEHIAAVKAIVRSPHLHGLLASGGGIANRCICFWNTTTNSHLSCMDTRSQVCNLVWSKNVNELVSTHGYSQNHIIVWRYPTMSKLATLTGHSYRVLYLAISPDEQTIVTGAGDETLKFWNAFPSPKSQNTESEIGASSYGRSIIR